MLHVNLSRYVSAVLGTVVGVDENTALSWLSCPYCNEDKLSGGTATK